MVSVFLGKRRNAQFDFFKVCVCVRRSYLRKEPQFLARFLLLFFGKAKLDGRGSGGVAWYSLVLVA